MKHALFVMVFILISMPMNAQNETCNCCSEKHTEFDFWIGEWSVINPDGTEAGYNIIDKTQNNCMLRERWTSASEGYTGTSSNFYNAKTKQWEQIWIDNQGGTLHLKGTKVDNQMILKTEPEVNKDGDFFYHRLTWTDNPDGTVRQYWETIIQGKAIVVAFDGLYKKR